MNKLATEFAECLEDLKPYIEDDYRATDDPDDDEPGMQVTFGVADRKPGDSWEWNYQTGDNSFTGSAYHYPHWAVVYLYRDSDCRELAVDAASEILELIG